MMGKQLNKDIISLASACVVVCALFNGCKKQDASPVPASTPPVQTAPQANVQKSASSVKKAQSVLNAHSSSSKVAVRPVIDFSNRKDPFKPAIAEVTQAGKPSAKDSSLNMNLLPIQRIEVDKFRITGIIAGLKENRALLVDPEGKAYVAKSGMLIGPNNGKVTRITANTLEVDERFKDEAGRIRSRTVKLTLQRKK